jgi:hypothetical protein
MTEARPCPVNFQNFEEGRSMSESACSRRFDCGLSISMRWISSVIADFVFASLSCVLVCESSA